MEKNHNLSEGAADKEEPVHHPLDPQDSPIPGSHYLIALAGVFVMVLFSVWLVSYLLP
jgi:hypothetical protein